MQTATYIFLIFTRLYTASTIRGKMKSVNTVAPVVSVSLRTKYTQSTYEVHPKYDTVIQTVTRKNSEKGVLLYFFLKILPKHSE